MNLSGIFCAGEDILDLFDNPVGYLPTCGWLASLAVFQAKALQNRAF
jgi:hypothetical protein